MWLGSSAIPPIPHRAIVTGPSLARASETVARMDGRQLTQVLAAMKGVQPDLGGWIARKLAATSDDAARALGVVMAACVWLAFEHATQGSLGVVDARELDNARQLLELDEELRKVNASETVESEDVVASMQPQLGAWLSKTMSGALGEAEEVDVDEAAMMLRMVLVQVLALSYAAGPSRAVAGS